MNDNEPVVYVALRFVDEGDYYSETMVKVFQHESMAKQFMIDARKQYKELIEKYSNDLEAPVPHDADILDITLRDRYLYQDTDAGYDYKAIPFIGMLVESERRDVTI